MISAEPARASAEEVTSPQLKAEPEPEVEIELMRLNKANEVHIVPDVFAVTYILS